MGNITPRPVEGQPVTVVVTITTRIDESIGQSATVGAWLDLDNNGRFENSDTLTEFKTFDVTESGTTSLSFLVPEAKNEPLLYSRIRIAYDQSEVGTIGQIGRSASSGEVEDHTFAILVQPPVQVVREFGDLPNEYGTLEANNGPYHEYQTTLTSPISPHVQFGPTIDPDDDGQPSRVCGWR